MQCALFRFVVLATPVQFSRNGVRDSFRQRSAAAHEKRTEADLVLGGSHGCVVFYCFRYLRDAVVEISFELTG